MHPNTLFNCLVAFCLFISNLNSQNVAAIHLKIENSGKEALLIYPPVEGNFFNGSQYYDSTDVTGLFHLYLEINEPGFGYLLPEYYQQQGLAGIPLFLEAGKNYNVVLDKNNPSQPVRIDGDRVNQFINNLPRISNNPQIQSQWAANKVMGKSAQQVYNELTEQKHNELFQLYELEKIVGQGLGFVQVVATDIHYYYVHLFHLCWVAATRPYPVGRETDKTREWNYYQDVFFNEKPISNPEGLTSHWYKKFLDDYLNQYLMIRKQQEIHTRYADAVGWFSTSYRIIQDYFEESIRDYMLASFLFGEVINQNTGEEANDFFKKWMMAYPSSPYLPYLEVFFRDIVVSNFDFANEATFSIEGIETIEDGGNINTIEELLQPFAGKTVYVDIWASWCGPCKEQFIKKKPLETFVENKNIELLYISIDEVGQKGAWLNTIRDFSLKGHHILANPNLKKAVEQTFGQFGILFLPSYGIVDKYGKVVVPQAKKPADGQELLQQLEQY